MGTVLVSTLAMSASSHRTRRRLQISRRTTSSLAPGTVRSDRAEREFAGGAVRETSRQARVWRQVVGFCGIGQSAVAEVVQPGGVAGEAPAGEAALSLRLASVQPHLARAPGPPACTATSATAPR